MTPQIAIVSGSEYLRLATTTRRPSRRSLRPGIVPTGPMASSRAGSRPPAGRRCSRLLPVSGCCPAPRCRIARIRSRQVAGYGVFWADPVTGVGLVERMRTEDGFQRRGIASHLLAAGLDGLAQRGCQRLNVSNDIPLYLRAGFRPLAPATARVYCRRAGCRV